MVLPNAFDNANSQISDVTCKLSSRTQSLTYSSSWYYSGNTFFETNGTANNLVIGVNLTQSITAKNIFLTCRLNLPANGVYSVTTFAGTNLEDTSGYMSSTSEQTLYSGLQSVAAAAYKMTFASTTATTWTLYLATTLYFATLTDSNDRYLTNGVGIYNADFYNATKYDKDESESTLALDFIVTPSMDTTASDLVSFMKPNTFYANLRSFVTTSKQPMTSGSVRNIISCLDPNNRVVHVSIDANLYVYVF